MNCQVSDSYRILTDIERSHNLSICPTLEGIRVYDDETVLALWLRADWAERARLWYNRTG